MLAFESVHKNYPGPGGPVKVLENIGFRLEAGDMAVVQGPSGCGKSTLLFTAGAMLAPDGGRVLLDGNSLYDASPARRNRLRGNSVGFIFQQFHLVPYLDVEENILCPLRWSSDPALSRKRLPALARRLGITHRLAHRPAQLSAGEKQRVAVARALVGGKRLVCADEPTGNLDEENAAVVLDVLREEVARGAIIVLATHQAGLDGRGNVHFRLRDRVLETVGGAKR